MQRTRNTITLLAVAFAAPATAHAASAAPPLRVEHCASLNGSEQRCFVEQLHVSGRVDVLAVGEVAHALAAWAFLDANDIEVLSVTPEHYTSLVVAGGYHYDYSAPLDDLGEGVVRLAGWGVAAADAVDELGLMLDAVAPMHNPWGVGLGKCRNGIIGDALIFGSAGLAASVATGHPLVIVIATVGGTVGGALSGMASHCDDPLPELSTIVEVDPQSGLPVNASSSSTPPPEPEGAGASEVPEPETAPETYEVEPPLAVEMPELGPLVVGDTGYRQPTLGETVDNVPWYVYPPLALKHPPRELNPLHLDDDALSAEVPMPHASRERPYVEIWGTFVGPEPPPEL